MSIQKNSDFFRKKIGVIGLSPGAGAGFFSVSLSRFLAESTELHPALIELKGKKLYDSLAMDRHFAGSEFIDMFCEIKNHSPIGKLRNTYKGVNWALKTPSDKGDDPGLLEMLRLVNNTPGRVIIVKIPTGNREYLWELLYDMDAVVAIIDPLPSSMLWGHELLCQLRTANMRILYVVNKMNSGVSRRELGNYLKIKGLHFIPMVDVEAIYSAEFGCKIPWDLPQINKLIRPPIETIARELIM